MKTSTLQLPKTIYACKKGKILSRVAMVIFFLLLIFLLLQIAFLFQLFPYQGKKTPLILNIVSYALLTFSFAYNAFFNCNKYYVQFDEDKIVYKTAKNKKKVIPYKDIDSHEIHIFEIVFHLKNGKKEVLNLDNFVYENIRKIKEMLLKVLG